MPGIKAVRVFISYARKDAADLANELHNHLAEAGLQPWLDTSRIAGGAVWTKDNEQAIDFCEVALALLSPGSYQSDICRAEQLRALRKGKQVIPILAKPGTDIPLHLETKNYLDLTGSGSNPPADKLRLLLQDIQNRKSGVTLRTEFRETYVTAPPLPRNYLPRPDALEALRNALLTEDPGPSIALTALKGMGGIGKTVLAQALCHDEVVQQAFPDGIIWITAGKESADDLVTRLREVGKGLRDDFAGYDTQLGSIHRYRNILREKAALIVVDDVWDSRDIEPFRAESPRSRLLFTTRYGFIADAVGAEQIIAGLELIRGAVRLSSNVIARDPLQFVSQLVGRLLPYEDQPAIRRYTSSLAQAAPKPWLRAMQPALHPPGPAAEKWTALLRTLEGHSSGVNGVAVSADGRRAVSASHDQTLKVWDVETGRTLRTLEGHSREVHGVAVSADGRRAVSASYDQTLKVWDVETGRELRTLEGHSSVVHGVGVSADGRRAVSASSDHTLKVWDLETGEALATFTADARLNCCAFANTQTILAGDGDGRVHFLKLETA